MPSIAFPDAARLDIAPLTARVRRADRQPPGARRSAGATLRYVVAPVVGVGAILIGALALAFGMTEEVREHAPDMVGQLVAMAGILALMLFAAGVLIVFSVIASRQRRSPKEQLRLQRFAAANGLTYFAGPFAATHLRWLQERGAGLVRNVLRTRTGRAVELGDFEVVTGTAGNRDTRFGGYCAIRLAVPLPNIVLRSERSVRHPATASAPPAGSQRLSLEGDFDDSFALYAPKGAERDALYLLTPDVMARLIDHAADWDVEVVDDVLLLTRARQVVVLDPAEWRRTADTIAAVTTRIERWERWRSAGAPTGGFGAPSGPPAAPSRLRTTASTGSKVWWLVIGGFMLVLLIASQIRV